MNRIKFINDNKEYFILISFGKNKIEFNTLNNISFSSAYLKCFESDSNLHSLLEFSGDRGISVIITDLQERVIFFASFIKNDIEKVIELYNVCKDFQLCELSPYLILKTIIKYFVKDNPIFNNYTKIRLAILKKTKYLEPALLLYTRLGFTVEQKNTQVVVNLPPYFSMIRDLETKDKNKVNFDHEYSKVIPIIRE